MSNQSTKSKKAATATAGEQSAKTNATEPAQSQPTTAPDDAVPGTAPAPAGTEATTTRQQRNISAAPKAMTVSPQLRRNSAFIVPTFSTVKELKAAFDNHDRAIKDALPVYAEAQAAANLIAEDKIIPYLSYMQSLLSKKGENHKLVIRARKQGIKMPWWTEYYATFGDCLWQSLGTIQRRIKEYRKDPTEPPEETEQEKTPKLNKAETDTLIATGHLLGEIVMENKAGRPIEPLLAKADKLIDAKRLDDILETARTLPDYRRHLERLLSVIESFNGTLPPKVTDAAKDIRKDITPKQAAAALNKVGSEAA